MKLTGHRGINRNEVGLLPQQIRSLLQNVQSMILGDTSLSIKVILEEIDIGFRWIFLREEFFCGRKMHGRGLHLLIPWSEIGTWWYMVEGDNAYILHNPFLGADSVSVLQLMLSEIDFGNYSSFLYFTDSLFKMCSRGWHCPRSSRLERLPRLFCRREWNLDDGKCTKGSGQGMQLAITRKGCTLQTQKGRTDNDLPVFLHATLYQLVVDYYYEPKYASKTCFATLNPRSVRI